MHRVLVIEDTDIIARRDDRPKAIRKRKIAQRGRWEKSEWGNARTYVPQTDYPSQALT